MRKSVIALGLVVLSAMVCAVPGMCATASLVLQPGENWVAPPLVPLNPNPTSVFAGVSIDGNLTRFDTAANSTIVYSSGNFALFGGILLGDGYKINNPTASAITISYEGLEDGVPGPSGHMTDMWVSLPGNQDGPDLGGMHWVGNPFAHDVSCAAMFVTDGVYVKSILDAVNSNWLDPLWRGFDAGTQTPFSVGLSQFGADESFFRAGSMYEIGTRRDNLALIIAPTPVPEPGTVATLLFGLGACGLLRRRRG